MLEQEEENIKNNAIWFGWLDITRNANLSSSSEDNKKTKKKYFVYISHSAIHLCSSPLAKISNAISVGNNYVSIAGDAPNKDVIKVLVKNTGETVILKAESVKDCAEVNAALKKAILNENDGKVKQRTSSLEESKQPMISVPFPGFKRDSSTSSISSSDRVIGRGALGWRNTSRQEDEDDDEDEIEEKLPTSQKRGNGIRRSNSDGKIEFLGVGSVASDKSVSASPSTSRGSFIGLKKSVSYAQVESPQIFSEIGSNPLHRPSGVTLEMKTAAKETCGVCSSFLESQVSFECRTCFERICRQCLAPVQIPEKVSKRGSLFDKGKNLINEFAKSAKITAKVAMEDFISSNPSSPLSSKLGQKIIEATCNKCASVAVKSIESTGKEAKDEVEFDQIPNDYSGKLQTAFYNMMAFVDFRKDASTETEFLDLSESVKVDLKVMNPKAFGLIHEMHGEDKISLVKSVCNSGNLSGGPSKGKSSSFFYLTFDKKFLLKTMTKSEWMFLKTYFLEKYQEHLADNPDSLLPKFFVAFKMTYGAFSKRFVLMNNVFDTELPIHEIFDLKGSTVGRKVKAKELEKNGPGKVIWKDLDFDRKRYKLHLPEALIVLLLIQLERDIEFLRSSNVIDYSLLLGIHNYARLSSMSNSDGQKRGSVANHPNKALAIHGMTNFWEDKIKSKTSEAIFKSTAATLLKDDLDIGANILERTLFFERLSGGETKGPKLTAMLPKTSSVQGLLKSYTPLHRVEQGGICGRDNQGKLLPHHYFMGIIDILQPYNARKALETQMKSLQHEAAAISCVDPDLYAARLFKRMNSMFA